MCSGENVLLLFQIQLQDFQRVRDTQPECEQNGRLPVDLDLEHVLASMPCKVSSSKSVCVCVCERVCVCVCVCVCV